MRLDERNMIRFSSFLEAPEKHFLFISFSVNCSVAQMDFFVYFRKKRLREISFGKCWGSLGLVEAKKGLWINNLIAFSPPFRIRSPKRLIHDSTRGGKALTIRGHNAINILNESLILVSFFSSKGPFGPVSFFVGGRKRKRKAKKKWREVGQHFHLITATRILKLNRHLCFGMFRGELDVVIRQALLKPSTKFIQS